MSNQPTEIYFGSTRKIVYLYSASGQKLVKQIVVNNNVTLRTDYIHGMEVTPSTLTTVVQAAGGRFVKQVSGTWEPQYLLVVEENRNCSLLQPVNAERGCHQFYADSSPIRCYYTDQRGDVRLIYRPNSTTGTAEVVQKDHLTPFGVQMVGLSRTNWPENQYRYQGKELNTTGFDTDDDGIVDSRLYQYDFSARQYDPLIGRWHSADPANQYSSPYVAMSNNWITRIDPDGRFADRIKGHQVYGITAYYYWGLVLLEIRLVIRIFK